MALRGKKVLIVITSHGTLGKTKSKTGTWLEELAAPYYTFVDNHAEVTLASPKGGQPPVDPKSEQEEMQTEDTKRFLSDARARQQFANTVKLANIDTTLANFDAVFYPGGHGPLFDLVDDPQSITLLKSAIIDAKPIGAVCHGPAVFRNIKGLDGMPLVHRKNVTGFSNSEERAVGLVDDVPFLLEDMLKSQNGVYTKADDWKPHVVTDGLLVTGQNPASSKEVAQSMVRLLKQAKK